MRTAVSQLVLIAPELVVQPETATNQARAALARRYGDALVVNPELSRALVSFQANKNTPFYRWFKYKEGFSSQFVSYALDRFRPPGEHPPALLDPFAGAGTTLTTATRAGWRATGIELLPVGTAAMTARLAADTVDPGAFDAELRRLATFPLDASDAGGYAFPHLRITQAAFPPETELALSAYHAFLGGIADTDVRGLFHFACLSILEDVSYTRKDGQYLRWDARSGKSVGSRFDKGPVHPFRERLLSKLELMREDISRRNGGTFAANVRIIRGSCLEELPRMDDAQFDLVITSPPYCNRYDYTRTYALELAYLGYGEAEVKALRQALLSATVENKSKVRRLEAFYRDLGRADRFEAAMAAFADQAALQEVLHLLYAARTQGKINNANVPGMVENYFFEMSFVVHDLARALRPGGRVVMVNDNVQYIGEEVPVDLILSSFAESAGLRVEQIWVLARGKGNSSQQMGAHGRNELRKCVYVWRKPLS
jgi:hypothetical protein